MLVAKNEEIYGVMQLEKDLWRYGTPAGEASETIEHFLSHHLKVYELDRTSDKTTARPFYVMELMMKTTEQNMLK